MVFFILFQHVIPKSVELWNKEMPTYIGLVEEVTIVLFSLLAIIEFYRNKDYLNWSYGMLFSSITFFVAAGIVSGYMNGNDLLITVIGIFDYQFQLFCQLENQEPHKNLLQ